VRVLRVIESISGIKPGGIFNKVYSLDMKSILYNNGIVMIKLLNFRMGIALIQLNIYG